MRRAAVSFVLLLASSSLGCAFAMPRGDGSTTGSAAAPASKPVYTKDEEEKVRQNERQAYAAADDAADQSLDRSEKETIKTLKLIVGQASQMPGMPLPESASSALIAIKAAKMKVRLEPVADGDGNAINGDFLQLKDSFTDRVMQLQRKLAEGKASKAELKEVQQGSKQIMKLNDLRMQVMALSLQAMGTNNAVQSMSLGTVMRVSGMVRLRKVAEMSLTAEDYALVKRGLERQKRAEAIAATTMAMLAAYQAVINDNGDPKAIDIIAEGALKAFPVKVQLTDDDAKQYVSSLGENVDKVKSRYEAMMRKAHGDARYEKSFKAGVDAMFAQASTAQSQKSVAEMAKDNWEKYKADVQKCKSGIDPAANDRIGPTCSEVYRAAKTGDTSQLMPGAKKAVEETGGLGGGGGGAAKGRGSREANALNGVAAAANGDVDGAFDSAGKMFPGDSTIGASLQGIQALRKGDARGAISAALSFVPIPGLKDAFGLASKLLFKN